MSRFTRRNVLVGPFSAFALRVSTGGLVDAPGPGGRSVGGDAADGPGASTDRLTIETDETVALQSGEPETWSGIDWHDRGVLTVGAEAGLELADASR